MLFSEASAQKQNLLIRVSQNSFGDLRMNSVMICFLSPTGIDIIPPIYNIKASCSLVQYQN